MPNEARYITNQIHNVYIADGFADDCEELIHKCSQLSTLSFEKFCDIWKGMNFVAVFHGRPSGAEIAELSEETLHIAKHYMVANTSNFEESVAGLFLVYSLLNLQPFAGFAALRVIQDDVSAIQRIEMVARRERRYDVLYILGSVLIHGPCQFHVAQRERGMEYPLRKYLEGYTGGIDRLGVRPKGVFYRQNEELDIIRELNTIGKRYSEVKKAVCGSSTLDRSLSYTSEKLPSELNSSLKKIITGIIHDERDDDADDSDREERDDASKHTTSVQSIKAKAMKTSVNPIQHLTGIQERTNTKPRRSPKKTDLKTSPGKIKTTNRKAVAASSPRKRKPSPRSGKSKTPSPQKKKPKRQKPIKFESDSDDQTSPDEDLTMDSSEETTPEPDIGICKYEVPIQEPAPELEPAMAVDPIPETGPDISQQTLDIQINSLPVLIRTEHDGQLYEIEIIDNFEGSKSKPLVKSPPKKQKPELIFKQLPEVSIKKINGSECESPGDNVKESNEMAQISKISYGGVANKIAIPRLKCKKPERRELKQSALKSKFKRMGILPVANFDDPNKIT